MYNYDRYLYYTYCLTTTVCTMVIIDTFSYILRLGASMSILRKKEVSFGCSEVRWVAEVLVRKVPDNQQVKYGCSYMIHGFTILL